MRVYLCRWVVGTSETLQVPATIWSVETFSDGNYNSVATVTTRYGTDEVAVQEAKKRKQKRP